MTFDEMLTLVLHWEGGERITADPKDPGGLTKWGICLRAYPELGENGIRNLTRAQARSIYQKNYYQAAQVAKFPACLRLALFDAAVNHGVKTASRLLQEAIKRSGQTIVVDGKIGPKTIEKAKAVQGLELMALFLHGRLDLYRQLDTYSHFGRGWELRLMRVALHSRFPQ